MQIKLESAEVTGNQCRAIVSLEGTIEEVQRNGYEIRRMISEQVVREVVRQLSEKMILEMGASILEKINQNQLINSVIMHVGRNLGGDR